MDSRGFNPQVLASRVVQAEQENVMLTNRLAHSEAESVTLLSEIHMQQSQRVELQNKLAELELELECMKHQERHVLVEFPTNIKRLNSITFSSSSSQKAAACVETQETQMIYNNTPAPAPTTTVQEQQQQQNINAPYSDADLTMMSAPPLTNPETSFQQQYTYASPDASSISAIPLSSAPPLSMPTPIQYLSPPQPLQEIYVTNNTTLVAPTMQQQVVMQPAMSILQPATTQYIIPAPTVFPTVQYSAPIPARQLFAPTHSIRQTAPFTPNRNAAAFKTTPKRGGTKSRSTVPAVSAIDFPIEKRYGSAGYEQQVRRGPSAIPQSF
jgi:hypothetical protein